MDVWLCVWPCSIGALWLHVSRTNRCVFLKLYAALANNTVTVVGSVFVRLLRNAHRYNSQRIITHSRFVLLFMNWLKLCQLNKFVLNSVTMWLYSLPRDCVVCLRECLSVCIHFIMSKRVIAHFGTAIGQRRRKRWIGNAMIRKWEKDIAACICMRFAGLFRVYLIGILNNERERETEREKEKE